MILTAFNKLLKKSVVGNGPFVKMMAMHGPLNTAFDRPKVHKWSQDACELQCQALM